MIALTALLPLVSPLVPGAADIAITAAARQAAIEFCERSFAHQSTLAPIPSTIGQANYALPLPAQTVMARLLACHFGGWPIHIGRPADNDGTRAGQVGMPGTAYTEDGALTITLVPAPSAAGTAIVVRAALRPAQNASALHPGVYERHAQAIAQGAAALLLAQGGKPYSDLQRAGAMRMLFESALVKAMRESFYGNARSAPRVPAMYF